MAWAIARAAVQSITIDEANTYVQFVSQHLYLRYAANNHILNSTLMYGFTRLLGLSQFTARLPALLGAALYISAAYRLCRLLGASLFVQLTVFVCLVFNPFIFDYLVAARGYSLALGFLMWALVFSAESQIQGGSLIVACAVSSACAGYVRQRELLLRLREPVGDARDSFQRLVPAPERVDPPASRLRAARRGHLRDRLRICLVHTPSRRVDLRRHWPERNVRDHHRCLAVSDRAWTFWRRSCFRWWVSRACSGCSTLRAESRPLGWTAAAIFAVTVAIHWTAFRLFGLLLPKDRTAIYFFPLFMIVAGVLAAIPPSSPRGRYPRAAFVGSLAILAIYFLSCLRLTYFKEWYWDADVQRTYAVLSCLNREHQVTRVASTWAYRGPLNFYRLAQPNSIQEIDRD